MIYTAKAGDSIKHVPRGDGKIGCNSYVLNTPEERADTGKRSRPCGKVATHQVSFHYQHGGGVIETHARCAEHTQGGGPSDSRVEVTSLSKTGLKKALPKKSKEEKTKKAPTQHASAKKTGKNGKTRYSYPADKDNDRKRSAGKGGDKKKSKDKDPGRPAVDAAKEEEQAEYQPPPRIPQLLPIDIGKLSAQLGLSQETLTHVVHRFADHSKLGGQVGFAKFMLSQARAFCEKHGLDSGYLTRAYDAILAADPDGTASPATGL